MEACKRCGKTFTDESYMGQFLDGYHIDCWPGYDSCARLSCHHYRCEHVFAGERFTTVYSKDESETVGQSFEPEVGCMVHDGPKHCHEFIEPSIYRNN
jgi:hypothetical protein